MEASGVTPSAPAPTPQPAPDAPPPTTEERAASAGYMEAVDPSLRFWCQGCAFNGGPGDTVDERGDRRLRCGHPLVGFEVRSTACCNLFVPPGAVGVVAFGPILLPGDLAPRAPVAST